MRIYGFLRPEAMKAVPEETKALDLASRALPVWITEPLGIASDERAFFRATREFGAEERSAVFYGLIALSNRIAVADRMELGDPESLPGAIDKATRFASDGLEHVASENGSRSRRRCAASRSSGSSESGPTSTAKRRSQPRSSRRKTMPPTRTRRFTERLGLPATEASGLRNDERPAAQGSGPFLWPDPSATRSPPDRSAVRQPSSRIAVSGGSKTTGVTAPTQSREGMRRLPYCSFSRAPSLSHSSRSKCPGKLDRRWAALSPAKQRG